jgi:hypothetical protein
MAAGSHYTDEHIPREAVACDLLHGNWRRVSELLASRGKHLTTVDSAMVCDDARRASR